MCNKIFRKSVVFVCAALLCSVFCGESLVMALETESLNDTKGDAMNVLIVLTSHAELGGTGEKTGFWLEEFAAPFYVFKDAGVEIVLASPKGGHPPLDPKSDLPDFQTESTKRFKADAESNAQLANTVKLSTVDFSSFDAVFYPGGHGPLWDLVNDASSIALIKEFLLNDRPVGAVCHAPAVLKNVVADNGEPVVKGVKLTGFSNSEEAAVGLTKVVPFLLEDDLQQKGAVYSKGEDWMPYVLRDGNFVTGQNPASSKGVAEELLDMIKEAKSH